MKKIGNPGLDWLLHTVEAFLFALITLILWWTIYDYWARNEPDGWGAMFLIMPALITGIFVFLASVHIFASSTFKSLIKAALLLLIFALYGPVVYLLAFFQVF